MKILQVASDMAKITGGPPVGICNFVDYFACRGHQLTIAAIRKHGDPIDMTALEEKGVEVCLFDPTGPLFIGFSFHLTLFLLKRIREFDLIIINSLYLYHTLAGGYIARRSGKPYIIQPHGSLDPFLYSRHRFRKYFAELLFQNRILANADAIWYATEEEKQLGQWRTGNSRALVCPYLIDYRSYQKISQEDSEKKKQLPHKKIILFLGRINFKKGLDIILRSYSELYHQDPDMNVRLVIAGPIDPDMKPKLEKWETALGIVGCVEYPGLVDGQRKNELLSSSTVFVLPSYSESFGIAVVEAIAAGLPVIISDRVNIHREIASSDCGLVIPPSSDHLTAALRKLLRDPVLYRRLRENTSTCIGSHYDRDVLGHNLENALQDIVAGAPSSRDQ